VNVLFLCTGNSARSIMAEAYLNHVGKGRYRAYSAGSKPSGTVNPLALELLRERGINASAHSKSWDEFSSPDAPKMDMVVTVCDNAAAEPCPYWPGQPIREHWGVEDPASVGGTTAEKRQAFQKAFALLAQRIDHFLEDQGREPRATRRG
jgi:arsenate reductase